MRRVVVVLLMIVVTAVAGMLVPFVAPLRVILHRLRSGVAPAARVMPATRQATSLRGGTVLPLSGRPRR